MFVVSEKSGVSRCLSDMVCDVVYWCWCGDGGGGGNVIVVVISSVTSSCSSPRCSWSCRHAGSGPKSGAGGMSSSTETSQY